MLSLSSGVFLRFVSRISLLSLVVTLGACERKCPASLTRIDDRCTASEVAGAQPVGEAGSSATGGSGSGGTQGERSDAVQPPSQKAGASADVPTPAAGSKSSAGAGAGGMVSAPSSSPPAIPVGGRASTPSGSAGSAGGESVAPAKDPCSIEGAIRCASAMMGARDACTGGEWQPIKACAAGETCTMAGSAATCTPLVALCQNRPDEIVCDEQGTMLQCSRDGTATIIDSCSSPMLCKAGIESGMCSACVPGSHMCKGKTLLTCTADGTGSMSKDCMSEALCNEKSGACDAPACQSAEVRCLGDTLKTCLADLTGWDESSATNCGPSMCDQTNKRCRACTPGMRKCSGDSLQVCDAQGQQFATRACDFGKSHCVDAGVCVQCTSDSHCATHQTCASHQCKDREALRVQFPGALNVLVSVAPGYRVSVTVVFNAADSYEVATDDDSCKVFHTGTRAGGDPSRAEDNMATKTCVIQPSTSPRVITFRGTKGGVCPSGPMSGRTATIIYDDGVADPACNRNAAVSLVATPG